MAIGDATKLLEFLAPYPSEVQAVAMAARGTLWKLVEPANEIFWDATQAVCSGFTYTEKTTDCFVNLAVYPKHVTLIFSWGVNLVDSERRLKGEGSRVRNYRLADETTVDDPYVIDLIRQAQAAAKRPPEPMNPITIVKVMNGPKKRPRPIGT